MYNGRPGHLNPRVFKKIIHAGSDRSTDGHGCYLDTHLSMPTGRLVFYGRLSLSPGQSRGFSLSGSSMLDTRARAQTWGVLIFDYIAFRWRKGWWGRGGADNEVHTMLVVDVAVPCRYSDRDHQTSRQGSVLEAP